MKIVPILEVLKHDKKKLTVVSFLLAFAGFCLLMVYICLTLPDVKVIEGFKPSETTVIYSADGEEIARLFQEENRRVVPLDEISPYLVKAVIAIEDNRFYKHHGIDPYRMLGAVGENLLTLSYAQGASTITQQLARNLFLTRKKKITRKLGEIILSLQIEKQYTKDEILDLYLNYIYWGHNSYGAESASLLYFGKSCRDLTLGEAALLAGLIEAPEALSPYKNMERAKNRQMVVLQQMVKNKFISGSQAISAYDEPFTLQTSRLRRMGHIGAYFVSDIVQELIKKYGEEKVYFGGLQVNTTLDARLQKIAEDVIGSFIQSEGELYNFSQAALVAIDPSTGYIKALVGGVDFIDSKFNRAVQSKRQPGSSFKTFVYTAALEQHFSPGMVILDAPTTYEVPSSTWNPDGKWSPMNFDTKFNGPVTMQEALERSLNVPSIKLMDMVGVSPVISLAHRMGITSDLTRSLALALGISEVSLLEMTSAYGTLANQGIYVKPSSIVRVKDKSGAILEENRVYEQQALDPNVAFAAIDMMKGVLTRGTGVRGQINRPAAAKTGTTQDFKDAWFIGFVPQLVCGVWVGNDDNTPMEGVAEVSVCPRLWKSFMSQALSNVPVLDFPYPKGMEEAYICLESGVLSTDNCPKKLVRKSKFWQDNVPKSYCPVHGGGDDRWEEIDSGEPQ